MLISTSDIAELVDERLPVVSTWRNRFKIGPNAFPQPAGGTPARPLFDFAAVREWVSANRPEKDLRVGLLRIRVWSALRPLSERIDQFDLIYWLHHELETRKRALRLQTDPTSEPESALGDEYLRTLFGLEATAAAPSKSNQNWPVEIATIKALIATATATELVEVSDFALARLSAGYGRSGGDIGAVGSNVSGILAAAATTLVADDVTTPLLYDPACGIGETLIRTYEQLGRSGRVIGAEINSRVAAVASIRFDLRDIPATMNVADTLSTRQFESQLPDLIVAEPPLGLQWAGVWNPDDPRSQFGVPPARNADLAWVADAASRLKGEATGLVLTSMNSLSNGGAEERVRANLLLRGAVRSIIALPPNLLQYTSAALALWVLQAPAGVGVPVRVVDASNPSLEGATASKRAAWVLANIADLVGHPRDQAIGDEALAVSVEMEDLLASGYDLAPSRWAAKPIRDDLSVYVLGHGFDLQAALQALSPIAPAFDQLSPAPHVVTIREMTEFPDAREAKLWMGRAASAGNDWPPDMITSLSMFFRIHALRPDDVTEEPGFRTEPGDIVFIFRTTKGTGAAETRVDARVDNAGGHRLGKGVRALRLLQPSRFKPDYVALCLAGKWNRRYQAATTKQQNAGDLEIPLLALDAQLLWIEAFATLNKRVDEAEDIIESAANLDAVAQDFLRFGHMDAM
ncbi:MAG: N-6 DNA methylase [Kineosporiaceae bacterium]|nr:N-6 DNA methylase [Aeromicrobium sp.]